MIREEIILTLRNSREELTNRFGVKSLALFGSVARDEMTPASDVDMLVEFDRPVGLFGLFALQDYLKALFDCQVDLGPPFSLKPRIRENILEEAVRVA